MRTMVGRPHDAIDEVQGPPEDLSMYPRQIAPEDPHADELHASQEKDRDQNPDAQRGVDHTRDREDEDHDRRSCADRGDEHPKPACNRQRHIRERRQRFEREAQKSRV